MRWPFREIPRTSAATRICWHIECTLKHILDTCAILRLGVVKPLTVPSCCTQPQNKTPGQASHLQISLFLKIGPEKLWCLGYFVLRLSHNWGPLCKVTSGCIFRILKALCGETPTFQQHYAAHIHEQVRGTYLDLKDLYRVTTNWKFYPLSGFQVHPRQLNPKHSIAHEKSLSVTSLCPCFISTAYVENPAALQTILLSIYFYIIGGTIPKA